MKYKKYYLLVLVLTLFIGCNKVHAKQRETDCYYVSNDFSARYNIDAHKVYVDKAGFTLESKGDNEPIYNWNKDREVNDFTIPAYNSNTCPTYLILEYDKRFIHQYYVYATDSNSDAMQLTEAIGRSKKHYGYYAKYSGVSESEYDDTWYKRDDTTVMDPGGEETVVDCDSLFGDKNTEGTLANLIDTVLSYVRIGVPVLVILLGSIDMAKAVISSKEEDMKKAQTAFVKRIIVGVLVFFAPVIVDALMWLADIVWEGLGYSSCTI